MNKKLSALAILVVIVLGFFSYYKLTQKYTGPVEKIRIGVSKAAPELSSLLYIAEDQKYFSDEGLEVEQIAEENGIVAQQNTAKGLIDVATTIDFAFASDSFSENSLKVFATIARSKFVEIIARRDSKILTVSDLKRKKIGVVSKSASEFAMSAFLIFNNISPKDVTIVYLTFAEIEKAIETGKVDAVAVNDPFAYRIKNVLGPNSISWPAQNNPGVYWLLASSNTYIKLHGEAIERLLKALVTAEEFLKNNPEKSKQIVKDKLKLDDEYFNQTWAKSNFSVSLEQGLLITMEEEARFRIEQKLTDKTEIPHYLDSIYSNALKKVKHDAATIY